MDRSSRDLAATALAVSLGFLLTMMAAAQNLPSGGSQGTASRPETPEALLASELARLASGILLETSNERTGEEPAEEAAVTREGALEVAEILLQEALRLKPDDSGLYHRLAGAAELRGNSDLASKSRRDLLRLEPDNAATQWAVINTGMAKAHDVESRLSRLETLIGPRGTSLSPGVRSRLAYTAALLHNELGDRRQYAEHLRLAAAFDPTNRDAVGLIALETDLAANAPDIVARALGRVIIASPLSPGGVHDLAALLMEWGVFKPAIILYECDLLIAKKVGRDAEVETIRNLALARASVGDFLAALDQLDSARQGDSATWSRRDWIALLTARAEIARSVDDPARQRDSLNDLFEALEDSETQPVAEDESDAPVSPERLEQAWLSLWFDREIDTVEEVITAIEDHPDIPADVRTRLVGWWELRSGAFDEALGTLTPWAEFDPAAAVGLGLLEERRGRNRAAAGWLANAVEMAPGTILGLGARREYERLVGRPIPISKEARRLEGTVGKLPETLRTVITNPQRGIHISARPGRISGQPLEAIDLLVRIRNDSPWPLAIAPDSILSDRVALVPAVFIDGQSIEGEMAPITVRLDQRLFLKPGEWLDVTVDVRDSEMGGFLDSLANERVTLRFQVILGFIVDPDTGNPSPGPWGMAREVEPIDIYRFPESVTNVDAVIEGLSGTDEKGRFRSLAVLGSSLVVGKGGHPSQPLEVLGTQWPGMSEEAKAYALCRLPPAISILTVDSDGNINQAAVEVKEVVETFEGIAAHSPGRLGRMVWLCTRSRSPNDPILADAMRSDDETLRAFAAALSRARPSLKPASP